MTRSAVTVAVRSVRWRWQLLGQLRAARPVPEIACAVLLLRALVPAGTALAVGGLIGGLLSTTSVGQTATALAWLAGLLLTGQLVELAIEPLRFIISRRVDGANRRATARAASNPIGIDHLEDPTFQDDLSRAAADPANWTESTVGAAAWAQLSLLFRYAAGLLAAAVLARDSWWLAVLLLGSVLAFRFIQQREFIRPVRAWQDGIAHRRRAMYWASLMTGTAAAKEMRIFGFDEWVQRRYDTETALHLEPFRQAKLAKLGRQWRWLLLVVAAMAITLFVLGDLAVAGRLDVAALSTDLLAAAALLHSLSAGAEVLDLASGATRLDALRRIRSRTGSPPAPVPARTGPSLPVGTPHLRWEAVGFTYPGADRPVLDHLDLELNPGEVLGLVGLNGAGKTTIVKLLGRLHDPDHGRITADGIDVRDLDPDAWRRGISVVFQDFARYELTVYDNIALGRPEFATDADIRAAAQQAGVTTMINELPRSWWTPLAPGYAGGVDLSGGQWQRIALARALLAVRAGARILVLDEPTAHLDVQTEFEVFHQVITAASGASVILISHRLSTVREADRIVLLDGGRVVESGSHDALIGAGGRYARLFDLQAEQFAAPATTAPSPTGPGGGW